MHIHSSISLNVDNVVFVVVVARRRQQPTSTVRQHHVSYASPADWLQSTAAGSGNLLSNVWLVWHPDNLTLSVRVSGCQKLEMTA